MRNASRMIAVALAACAPSCSPPTPAAHMPPEIPEVELMEKPVARLLKEHRGRILADLLDHNAWGQFGAGLHAHLLFEEALTCYGRARELNANMFPYPYLAAIASERLGRPPAECSALYQVAAELEPGFAPVFVRLGDSLLQNGEEDQARAAYERALAISSDYGAAHRALGQLLIARGDAAEAVEHLEIALREAPDDRGTNIALAQAYGMLGVEDERVDAIRAVVADLKKTLDTRDSYIKQIVAMRQSASECRTRANQLMQKEDYKGAIVLLRLALEGQPDNAWSHERLGRCYELTGSPELARKRFERTIELEPESPRARIGLARLLISAGQRVEALEQLDTVLANDANHDAALRLASRVHASAKDHERACAVFESAPRPSELSADAQILWGTNLVHLERLEEAAKHFETAATLAPDSASAHYSLGMTYETLGRLPEAIAEFELGVQLDPNHPGAAHLRKLRSKH